jgi:hypothetical protein
LKPCPHVSRQSRTRCRYLCAWPGCSGPLAGLPVLSSFVWIPKRTRATSRQLSSSPRNPNLRRKPAPPTVLMLSSCQVPTTFLDLPALSPKPARQVSECRPFDKLPPKRRSPVVPSVGASSEIVKRASVATQCPMISLGSGFRWRRRACTDRTEAHRTASTTTPRIFTTAATGSGDGFGHLDPPTCREQRLGGLR